MKTLNGGVKGEIEIYRRLKNILMIRDSTYGNITEYDHNDIKTLSIKNEEPDLFMLQISFEKRDFKITS